MKVATQKGVTLIVLVVTIVILLILAGVTIYSAFNKDGLIDSSKEIKNIVENSNNEIAQKIENLLGELDEEETENDPTTPQDKTGPIITITKGTVTTNSIQVTVTATDEQSGMPTNPEYKYYIKPTSTTTWPTTASYSGTNTSYTFTELTQNTSYDIKVTTQDIAGNTGEKTLTGTKTEQITGGLATGEITVSEVTWSSGLASITLSTTTSLTIQYKVGESGTWTTGTSVTGLKHGDVVYARLTDGNNYGSEASVNILDGTNPTASISLSANSTEIEQEITATVTHTDNESGVDTTSCKYIYNTTSTNIGTTSSAWNSATAFSSNSQTISLTATTEGTYYLHVLTVDKAGNKTETVSEAVTVEVAVDPMDIYVTLYTDGTLGFNNNSKTMSEKTVQTSYGNIKGQIYNTGSFGKSTTPWDADKNSILVATFNSIIIPENTACWFYNCSNMTEITNISKLNTSQVTSMSNMFYGCKGLTNLDVGNFNTSNVTVMNRIFSGCSELTSLNVSNFNTDNVTDMSGMFSGCKKITSLDVSNFNTSNVTNMSKMFSGCTGLTSLDVSNFNTSNVTDMSWMFSSCSGLTNIDVSNFNTSNVTNMQQMFGYDKFTSLNLSNFNTSKVTNMSYMFQSCSELTSLDLSNFNTSRVTTMKEMLSFCKSLISIDLSTFDTSNVTDMYHMISDCDSLTSVNLSNFNTSKVTDMTGMFYRDPSLTSINLTSFNTSNVTIMSYMFYECSKLSTIYVSSNFVTTNVTESENMFYLSPNLKGGNGTTYNSSYIDKTYARIDKAGAPGYFTQK